MNQDLTTRAMVANREPENSAKVTARSVASILNYQLKGIPETEKESAVNEYLKGKGWKVEN